MSHILLIEDDESLGNNLTRFLKDEGFNVSWSTTLESGKSEALKSSNSLNLIILDWMLPDGHGIDLLTQLRTQGSHLPVIMLTARTELVDKVLGLESGAEDYITKPFEPRELVSRIRVQLRNEAKASASHKSREDVLTLGDLELNHSTREVRFQEKKVEMTKMEYDFLKLLAENPNRAFSREEILNKVWGYENYPTTRTVDTHVLQIRHKLRDDLIETVRGIGYRLRYQQEVVKEP